MPEINFVTQAAPVAPPPAPAAPENPPAPLTTEERKKQFEETSKAMGWAPDKVSSEEPPAPAAPEPPAPTEPAAPADEPPAEPSAPASTEDVIQRTASVTAQAVAAEIRKTTPPSPEPAPAPQPEFEMNPEDQEIYRVLCFLENGDSKFAGKPAAFLEYLKKNYEYQDKWLADHEGKEFNPEDSEHDEWFAANPHPVDQKEIESGKIDMQVEEKFQSRIQPQLQKMEAEKAWKENAPMVATNVGKRLSSLVGQVDPELQKLFVDDKGNPVINAETIAKMEEKDPIAKDVLDRMLANDVGPMILELEKSAVPGANFKLQPDKFPVHAAIDSYRLQAEKDMAKAPVEVRVQDGREWKSIADFTKLQQEAVRSGTKAEKAAKIGELNAKYWTLSVDDVEELIIDDFAQRAKKEIDRQNNLAAKKYGRPGTPAPPTPAPAPPPEPVPAHSNNGKPRPPSISTRSDVVTTGAPGQAAQKSYADTATSVMFS